MTNMEIEMDPKKTVDFVTKGKRNILEQKTRQTIRIVLKPNH